MFMAAMPGLASAASSANAEFKVNLTINPDCNIDATDLNFGRHSTLENGATATSHLDVTCSHGTPYSVGLNAGNVKDSTLSNRLLKGGAGNAETVAYQLYQPDNKKVWGDTDANDRMAAVGSGFSQQYVVNGRIPTGHATPRPDDYSSIVTATVYF
jgi:spore coat protein U-like protein